MLPARSVPVNVLFVALLLVSLAVGITPEGSLPNIACENREVHSTITISDYFESSLPYTVELRSFDKSEYPPWIDVVVDYQGDDIRMDITATCPLECSEYSTDLIVLATDTDMATATQTFSIIYTPVAGIKMVKQPGDAMVKFGDADWQFPPDCFSSPYLGIRYSTDIYSNPEMNPWLIFAQNDRKLIFDWSVFPYSDGSPDKEYLYEGEIKLSAADRCGNGVNTTFNLKIKNLNEVPGSVVPAGTVIVFTASILGAGVFYHLQNEERKTRGNKIVESKETPLQEENLISSSN